VNELNRIVDAYAHGRAAGLRMAMVTVVSIEGSAYRRPGARMIVAEDGETTGAISGGCLERDVIQRALSVMETGHAVTVEYDTRGDRDIIWGSGLGCNGIVRLLIESLHEGSSGAAAIEFITRCLLHRKSGVMATMISMEPCGIEEEDNLSQPGQRMFFGDEQFGETHSHGEGSLELIVSAEIAGILAGGRSVARNHECETGRFEVFFDVIKPSVPLVIFGAEHDALPLVRQAKMVGWHVTVVDTRARPESQNRFVEADQVFLCRPDSIAAGVPLTEKSAVVVMTHNYLDDAELLRTLLPSPVAYLGILGPKQRTSALLSAIGSEFGLRDFEFARLHGPVGIDIGAETPEEIALSIVAEIKACSVGRAAGFLRDCDAPIHGERPVVGSYEDADTGPATSADKQSMEFVNLSSCPTQI
jgi:xanthine dehydrogenase accessory factor